MAEQIEYMELIHKETLPNLQNQLDINRKRLMYLIDVTILHEDHIALNNVTFTWPLKITPVLEQHNIIMTEAKSKAEINLKDRRMRFEQELEEMRLQVEELKNLGELNEASFYMKKAQSLTKQLQSAQDTITAFNKEEQIFGWDLTTYPQRKKILATLEPFTFLYSTAISFQKSFKKFMDGPLLELDAETIEADLESYQRDVYKLQSLLEDAPKANEISKVIIERIQEFSVNLPLIKILCNRGMRDRHWTKISDIAGFEIRPDAQSTLRKMIKMDLDKFVNQFQDVSGKHM
jgi:dynein heavy chain